MSEFWQRAELDRRAFLKGLAGVGGAMLAAGCAGGSVGTAAQAAARLSPPGRDRMGIQLYTVRAVCFCVILLHHKSLMR
jgi:anaerobic selenocysteine-containing dehydrogenase